jgi:D-galacturonate reductase
MRAVDLLVVGAGEYVTGYVDGASSRSDKSAGVVALVAFDLRRRGKIGRIAVAARDGRRFEDIRRHLTERVTAPYALDSTFEAFPSEARRSETAYLDAIATFAPGDAAIIVTPDDTHAAIATAAVQRGLHVLVAKPLVHTLEQHIALERTAAARGVLVAVEMHKRWDPIYADARERARSLGDFSFFSAYMSQPRLQLETFRAWAGRSSDISYYLNAHHVDVHAWILEGRARPLRVTASASVGVANAMLGRPVEDTIALQVEWEHLPSRNRGIGCYAASWVAPRSDVHSQQRFLFLAHGGEIAVDQAHRGYSAATDHTGVVSPNPLFMSYVPRAGRFDGQTSYGYRSIEAFVDAARALRDGEATRGALRDVLATAEGTRQVTAILEAGRLSLDRGTWVPILYEEGSPFDPVRVE